MHRSYRAALAASLCAALGLAFAGVASANEARVHDKGFFLRMSAGLGAASSSWDQQVEFGDGDAELSLNGVTGDANFAIGAIVTRNLAVHGSFWGWSMVDPTLESDDNEVELDDLTYSLSAFGAGLTFYTNSNWYFSGNVGAATATFEEDNVSVESDTGFAFDATVGKEWWVGDKWGLGVAAGLGFHSIPVDEDLIDDDFTGSSFALRFSATYN